MEGQWNCSPDIVQHQAFAVVEGDTHVPLLPAHLVTVHLKAGPLGLDDIQRLQACMQSQAAVRPNISRNFARFSLLTKMNASMGHDRHSALSRGTTTFKK